MSDCTTDTRDIRMSEKEVAQFTKKARRELRWGLWNARRRLRRHLPYMQLRPDMTAEMEVVPVTARSFSRNIGIDVTPNSEREAIIKQLVTELQPEGYLYSFKEWVTYTEMNGYDSLLRNVKVMVFTVASTVTI